MGIISGSIAVAQTVGGLFIKDSSTNQRKFSGESFSGLMTISENSRDSLTITDHPVEDGSVISDHAYMQPKSVTISFGYSELSWSQGMDELYDRGKALITKGTNPFKKKFEMIDINQMYEKLLKLQRDRIPFDIVTGKRKYTNMLIESISNETDATSENILLLEISCREVIIVYSEIKEINKADQKDASKTGKNTEAGKKQLGSN